MNRAILSALLAILFLAVVAAGLLRRARLERTGSPAPADAAAAVDQPLDPATTQRLLALEAARRNLDQTVWAQELLAEKHEAVVIRLWDELRRETNALAVFERFPFGELRWGTWSEPALLEHGIARRTLGSPHAPLSHPAFLQHLAARHGEGLRLEQSEWRLARFAPHADGTADSTFEVTLHAANSNPAARSILRGELHIRWRQPADGTAEPYPERIDATGLEWLSRAGERPFQHRQAADLTPDSMDANAWGLHLQLYDLDGDGLSEIVLARRNLVYWNKGRGSFDPKPLFARPLPSVDAAVIADFNGDGSADFLAADSDGLALFAGDVQGRFPNAPQRSQFAREPLANPFVLTAGDIDADGDLDLWLAQYKVPYQKGQMPTPYYDANDGYPAYLLVNDGRGTFQDRTEAAGLAAKRFRRTYSSSFADLDEDHDLDLVVVSDFAGADIYRNDGRGRFTEARGLLDEPHGFGMAHTFGDYDANGRIDMLMIGMNSYAAQRLEALGLGRPEFPEHQRWRAAMAFGNRLFFGAGAAYRQTPLGGQIARTGWSWGATSGDFDNDGDQDVYIVNGHISGETARDYEAQFWRHDLYTGTSAEDPVLALHFGAMQTQHLGVGESHGGFEKNRLFLNQGGQGFVEAGHLMGLALEEDSRCAVSDDLDGDGRLDLLATTFQTRPRLRQALHLFPNFTQQTGHWIGVRLRESRPGFSPLGAKVILTTATSRQIRVIVAGDSYRSQHAPNAHFGLGTATNIQTLEILWPNGHRQTLPNPAIDQYHSLPPAPPPP